MVIDVNILSPALMLGVLNRIEGLLFVSEKLNWLMRYMAEIELIDPTYSPDNIFICLAYNNIFSFSRIGKGSFLIFANPHN